LQNDYPKRPHYFKFIQSPVLGVVVGSLEEKPVAKAMTEKIQVELVAPHFTKEPTKSATVKLGETTTLLANIAGVPRPTGRCSGY